MVTAILVTVCVGVVVYALALWAGRRMRMLVVAGLSVGMLACVRPPIVPEVAVLTVKVTPTQAVVQVGDRQWPTRQDGTIVEEFSAGVYPVTVTADGYTPRQIEVMLASGSRQRVEVVLEAVPATSWCTTRTETQFRDWRGDIGGVRLSFDTSATRGNYFFTPTYMAQSGVFADAGNRRRALEEYAQRGYTHFAIGPMYEAGYPGWPGHDYRGDPAAWVERVEEIWQAGLIPVHWLMPNGPYNVGQDWNRPIDYAIVNREFTPLLTTPDMQRVTCMVVAGWEMTDRDWVKTIDAAVAVLSWQARVFPGAYRYWHAAVDNGAPCNYDIDGYGCEGKAWRAMQGYLHGHFWQTGAAGGWNLAAGRDPARLQDRIDQFFDNARYEVMRFTTGHYQSGGLRGADGKPLDVIVGEYSAYFELNDDESEDWGRAWGQRALTVPGVRGYGDGGR